MGAGDPERYTVARAGDGIMTGHFSQKELACKCGCGQLPSLALAKLLELARHIGGSKPITISSAMRCHEHNLKVGGVPDSLHLYGMAADVVAWGVYRANIPEGRKAIIDLFRLAGWYALEESRWVHADLRTFFPEIQRIRRL